MKNLITILMCAFCLGTLMGQNPDGPGRKVVQKTPELKALYAKERDLKNAEDLAGLEENQKAIIAAWQSVDETLAAEFQPIQISETKPFPPLAIQTRPDVTTNQNQKWVDDLELDAGFISGVDVDLALSGTIYVAAYENRVRYGLGNDAIRIYRSTNNGVSFSLWGNASVGDDIKKMKMTIMDKGATKYLFTTYLSVGGVLKNLRFNMAGGPLDAETINTGIKDFDIDVEYRFAEIASLYAVYIKADNVIYSAKTPGNSTGFSWNFEHNFNLLAKECAFAYGNQSTYVSFVGLNSGNLYFSANNGYNDPTAWDTPFVITEGSSWESKDISVSAERNYYSSYKALVLVSERSAGTADDYHGTAINIAQGVFNSNIITSEGNIGFWDSWCGKEDDNPKIKTSFENITAASCNVINYNDGNFGDSELISDNLITADRGSSAVAEDGDGNAIAVYIGPNSTGLYFDSNSNVAGVNDNALNGFVFYPNPASSSINLKAKSTINNVAVYNLLGQQVLNQKMDTISGEINVSTLSSGTYVMKVTIGSEIGTYKIIKN
jgi:hypothetical protein